MTDTNTTELLYGPSFTALRDAAFERADTLSDDGIRRILYIESNDRVTDEIATAWADQYPPLALDVVSFEDVVDHCYEHLFGVADTLGRQQRLRLIEQALLEIEDKRILSGASALLEDFSQLFASVEAAGIETATELDAALTDTALPERIRMPTVAAYRRFVSIRENHTSPRTKTRSERIAAVATADKPLQACYPSVDVVVIADRRSLPSVEVALLNRLADEFAFLATLPAVHQSRDGRGVDQEIDEVFDAYETLGCTFNYIPGADNGDQLHRLTQQFYVLSESDEQLTTDSLNWHEAPTTEREVRHVARSIRHQLANGVSPNDIIVVVPGLISYREQLADIFEAYEIPYVSFANKLIQQTHVGQAITQLFELARQPRTNRLVEFLSNPIVRLDSVDVASVAELNRRLPSQDCARLLAELSETDTGTRLERLLETCQQLTETDPTAVVETVQSILDQLDIEAYAESSEERGDRVDASLERRTLSQVSQVLDSVAEFTESGLVTDPLSRIERAISDLRIPAPRQETAGRVEIMGLFDARGKSFEHVYLVGATANTLPASSNQTLFFEQLEETVPALQTAATATVASDPQLDARYQFATLIASAQTAHLTTPEATTDDESVLPSAVLNEVARVTGMEPTDTRRDHGTAEDLQRTLAQYGTSEGLLSAVEDCTSAGVFSNQQATRLESGIQCATHRGDVSITAHDGQLDTDTVTEVFPDETLSTLSPSRIKGYAKCGFAYYLRRGLGLRTDDDIRTEPNTLDLGNFVHKTLYRFFTALQGQSGETVNLTDYERTTLERTLLNAAHATESELDFQYGSAFYTTWKSRLLAGLGSPAENEYFDPTTTGQPAPEASHSHPDRGFFMRFLDAECERDGELAPAWFETPVGFDGGESTFELPLPNGSTVSITGIVDRIDVDATTPPEATVIDYKTGSTNLMRTIDGVEFQLPLYALAAQKGIAEALEQPSDTLSVDAHFYNMNFPTGASLKGPLSEKIGDDVTDPAYQQFLTELTPQRIESITDAIHDGSFHPSVLGPGEAGCKYCDYKDACDVRHYDRHDVIQHIDSQDVTAYVADRGRDIDVADRLSVGGDAE